jgi:hypothetical protein
MLSSAAAGLSLFWRTKWLLAAIWREVNIGNSLGDQLCPLQLQELGPAAEHLSGLGSQAQ